jgi:hypothetical protein
MDQDGNERYLLITHKPQMRYLELKGEKGKQGMRGKLKSEAIKSEELISCKFHLKNRPVHTDYVDKKS